MILWCCWYGNSKLWCWSVVKQLLNDCKMLSVVVVCCCMSILVVSLSRVESHISTNSSVEARSKISRGWRLLLYFFTTHLRLSTSWAMSLIVVPLAGNAVMVSRSAPHVSSWSIATSPAKKHIALSTKLIARDASLSYTKKHYLHSQRLLMSALSASWYYRIKTIQHIKYVAGKLYATAASALCLSSMHQMTLFHAPFAESLSLWQ